ncbi:MAG: DUF1566 domain-containing protein [Bacteroidetes bacterium]|nr:DUF1566 domain-containing protein [Bacteroidota bacterium]MBU1719891.1 DUF1566 domain-containing protein [Bacteroidota bacterium]
MRTVFTVLAAVLLSACGFAQSPQKMNYQAIIRNSSNSLVADTQVGMQFSILQGSSTGTPVFVETQTPTTNANGLIRLEIGTGVVVTGSFASIDWSAGPYFLKIETDPTGGSSYSITGTSELLSVPYAFHATTADSVSGAITETDPVFEASPANGITSGDITTWNNKLDAEVDSSVTNEIQTISRAGTTITLSNGGGSFTDSNNVYTAGAGIDITGNVISTGGGTTLAIGNAFGGGAIFWLDASGQHGLIAALTDQSAGIQWSNGTYRNTGTTGDGVYGGAMNTAMIISSQIPDNQTGDFAAKVCADYSVTIGGVTYGDWYLPTPNELFLLFAQRNEVGGFYGDYYWSSSEVDSNIAWCMHFSFGDTDPRDKTNTYRIRAIRAF